MVKPRRGNRSTVQQPAASMSLMQHGRDWAKRIGVTTVIATVLSTGATSVIQSYSTVRTENKKIVAEGFRKRLSDFEATQGTLFTQLAAFDTDVLLQHTVDDAKKEEILKSVVATQLQLLDL